MRCEIISDTRNIVKDNFQLHNTSPDHWPGSLMKHKWNRAENPAAEISERTNRQEAVRCRTPKISSYYWHARVQVPRRSPAPRHQDTLKSQIQNGEIQFWNQGTKILCMIWTKLLKSQNPQFPYLGVPNDFTPRAIPFWYVIILYERNLLKNGKGSLH